MLEHRRREGEKLWIEYKISISYVHAVFLSNCLHVKFIQDFFQKIDLK